MYIYKYASFDEVNEHHNECLNNKDFSEIGTFKNKDEIYEHFEHNGFSRNYVDELSNAIYGHVIEIIYIGHAYIVHLGMR